MGKLTELAERCEQATGANKMLDEAIFETLAIVPSRGHSFVYPHYAFTASLDAALTLVPGGMVMAVTNCGTGSPRGPDWTKASAVVGRDQDSGVEPVTAATPALALCAAALRARTQNTPDSLKDG